MKLEDYFPVKQRGVEKRVHTIATRRIKLKQTSLTSDYLFKEQQFSYRRDKVKKFRQTKLHFSLTQHDEPAVSH